MRFPLTGTMSFARPSPIFSKSTAIARLAPLRLSSPLPLHFRRFRHDSSGRDQFFSLEEDTPHSRTAAPSSKKGWDSEDQLDLPKSQAGHESQKQNVDKPLDGPKSEDGVWTKPGRTGQPLFFVGFKPRPKSKDVVRTKPGRKGQVLSLAQAKADLAETDWQLSKNFSAIERTYTFRDFERAYKFICLLEARCKNSSGHFPMLSNWCNRLFVRWSSHNNACITRKDIQMARVCDRLFNDSFAASTAEQPKHPFDQIPDDLEWKDDRQVLFGEDYFYHAADNRHLWNWLPQLERYVLAAKDYPLWAISYNKLVWTSVLWDGKTGALECLTKEDRYKWRPGAPIMREREHHHWLSNVADQASQYWNQASWVDKPENPIRARPRARLQARSADKSEMEMKKNRDKQGPRKPQIFVD